MLLQIKNCTLLWQHREKKGKNFCLHCNFFVLFWFLFFCKHFIKSTCVSWFQKQMQIQQNQKAFWRKYFTHLLQILQKENHNVRYYYVNQNLTNRTEPKLFCNVMGGGINQQLQKLLIKFAKSQSQQVAFLMHFIFNSTHCSGLMLKDIAAVEISRIAEYSKKEIVLQYNQLTTFPCQVAKS